MNVAQAESEFRLQDILDGKEYVYSYLTFLHHQSKKAGIDSLDDTRRAILLTFTVQGVVANGGLRFYYEQDNEPDKVTWAFRQLGFEAAATAMERSKSVFPEGMLTVDRDKRIDWIDEHYDEISDYWDEVADPIMDLYPLVLDGPPGNSSELMVKVRKFITDHIDEFGFSR